MSKTSPAQPMSRPSKREQRRAERRRQATLWNVILLGGGGLTILAIAAYVFATARPGPLPGEQPIPDEGRGHVSSTAGIELKFNHYPPSSGTHYGDQVLEWGVYSEPVAEGVYLHNLGRGGVVILYQCPEACPELEQQFNDLFDKAPPDDTYNRVKILVSPYAAEQMPSPIVALAWGHQLNLQQFDERTLLRWYDRFVNRDAPEVGP